MYPLQCIHIPNKGIGIISTTYIPKGMFVLEYGGELINEETAAERNRMMVAICFILK
jgi:hypothetical protein